MSDLNIALYIEGTRIRHGGMSYILSVGGLAGNENEGEIDMPPISRNITQENPVITLKNAESYVYYKLWDSSIAPSDDENNPGRLAICMTMPSNARMRDNKSPYNLLMDIYHKFLELGTVQINENQRVFLNVDLDKGDFVKIIEQYPLERVSVKTEVMRGSTIAEIQVSKEKMEEFFRDAQYPEFVDYKAVEVTTQGRNMFPALQIPRDPSYEVFINGISTGKFLKDRYENFPAHLEPTNDVKYDSMKFSLDELFGKQNHFKQNQDNTASVQLNEKLRRIDCTLKPRNVFYRKQTKYTEDSDSDAVAFVKKGLSNNTIRIKLNGEDWNDEVKPSVAEDAVNNKGIDIYPHEIEKYKLMVHHARIDKLNEEVYITIKAIKSRSSKSEIGEGEEKNDIQSNRKFITGLVIGLVAGLILGIGGMMAWKLIQDNKAKKAIEKELKNAENTEYYKVINLPQRKAGTSIEDQDDRYLVMLQKEEGAKLYRNYLKEYAKDNTVCYDEKHFTEVKKRLSELVNDSTEYAEFLANETKLKAANDALKQIQDEIGKKKPNYDNIINLCNEYDEKFANVSAGNTDEVASIRKKAEEKKQDGQKADKEKERIENEALAFLNDRNYSGFTNWKDMNSLDKSKRNAVAWILDYQNNVKNESTLKDSDARKQSQYQNDVKNGIENYLTEIKFKDGSLMFKNWTEAMRVKTNIDEIISKKGKK